MRIFFVLVFILLALFQLDCSGGGFKILSNPAPDAEGFLTKDILQVTSVGFPSRDAQTPADRQREAYRAAEIQGRMQVVDFLMSELQSESAEKYQNVVTRLGGRLSRERYNTVYSQELLQGGQRADAHFELFSISGYVHTNTYTEETGRCFMLYRVAKADLVEYGKSGFGISTD
jgi:hypothetical protein